MKRRQKKETERQKKKRSTSTSTSSSRPPLTFSLSSASTTTPHDTTRDFLKAAAADLKGQNPGFLLLIREGEGVPAAAHARYDGGKEVAEKLDGLDAAKVEGVLAALVERGAKMPRTAESAGDLPGSAK